MPTALVIIYWIWTSVSLVVLAHRAARRLRTRRERRRAWQTLGARTVAADGTPVAPEPVSTAAVPRRAESVAPSGPPQPSRARARPRPADDLVLPEAPAATPNVTPVVAPIAARAVGTVVVAEVLAGVRLPDEFVPVIDDVVTAAAGRCLRFDAARPLVAAREDLVTALAAAGVETSGEAPDELVARRGEGAVRITLVQAPPSEARPVPSVRVELASLS